MGRQIRQDKETEDEIEVKKGRHQIHNPGGSLLKQGSRATEGMVENSDVRSQRVHQQSELIPLHVVRQHRALLELRYRDVCGNYWYVFTYDWITKKLKERNTPNIIFLTTNLTTNK